MPCTLPHWLPAGSMRRTWSRWSSNIIKIFIVGVYALRFNADLTVITCFFVCYPTSSCISEYICLWEHLCFFPPSPLSPSFQLSGFLFQFFILHSLFFVTTNLFPQSIPSSSTVFLSTSSLLSIFFTYENVLLSMSDSDPAFVSLPLPDCSIIICSYLESLISCSISFLIS